MFEIDLMLLENVFKLTEIVFGICEIVFMVHNSKRRCQFKNRVGVVSVIPESVVAFMQQLTRIRFQRMLMATRTTLTETDYP
jgi:hypothetical protein